MTAAILALALASTATFAGPSRAMPHGPAAHRTTIADIASESEDFEVLTAALDAAGMVRVLDGFRQYTVFAPTDDAFEAAFSALGVTAEDVLADTDLLTDILLYHVARGNRSSEQVLSSDRIRMLDGNFASISYDDEGAYIDDATIVLTDVEADNGVIHVIDQVLLPPGLF